MKIKTKETWSSSRKIQTTTKFSNTDWMNTGVWLKIYRGKARPTLVKRPLMLSSSISSTKKWRRSLTCRLTSRTRPTIDRCSTNTWSRTSSIQKYTPTTLQTSTTTWKMLNWQKLIWYSIPAYYRISRLSGQISSQQPSSNAFLMV